MEREKSCGAIIINDDNVLLIKQENGDWGFPKGHAKVGESEIETAKREVLEESGLEIIIENDKKYITNYYPKANVYKEVIFFIAKMKNKDDEVKVDNYEVIDYEWVNYTKVKDKLVFPNAKKLWDEVLKDYFLK